MRTLIFSILLFSFFKTNAQIHAARLQAAGLTCALCSKAIYQSLLNISFIQDVTPDLQHSSFLIRFKDNVDIDPEAIRNQVTESGFSIAQLTLITNPKTLELRKNDTLTIQGLRFNFLNVSPSEKLDSVFITLIHKGYMTEKRYKQYLGKIKQDKMISDPRLRPGEYDVFIE